MANLANLRQPRVSGRLANLSRGKPTRSWSLANLANHFSEVDCKNTVLLVGLRGDEECSDSQTPPETG